MNLDQLAYLSLGILNGILIFSCKTNLGKTVLLVSFKVINMKYVLL